MRFIVVGPGMALNVDHIVSVRSVREISQDQAVIVTVSGTYTVSMTFVQVMDMLTLSNQ